MALRAGLHPVTGLRLPAASGSTAHGSGTYSRLKPGCSGGDDFVPYIPATFVPPVPCGVSAERKRWLLRGRVLCRLGKEAAKLKRLRRKKAKEEVREVIRSFISSAEDEGQPMDEVVAVAGSGSSVENLSQQTREYLEQEMGNDDSDEEFWLALPTTDSRTNHIQSIPTQPSRSFPGRAVRSRVGALEVGCELSRKGYG